jgi:tRNA (guanine26-N2/guanine27-N2)-dimethyltransferase
MELREGSASLVVPKALDKTSRYAPSRSTVFYNPKMALNRDIAVIFLKTLSKRLDGDLTVCEPLGGCGVRAVRIALEVNGIKRIVVNDINSRAVKLIQLNVKKAGVLNQVEIHNSDANVFLSSFTKPGNRADYIDIDPFGSPSAYIEAGLMALRNNGVLVLTATDMAPLCGVHSKACVRRYGAKPLRVEYCHELAVRILIGRTVIAATRRDLAVEPLLCHSTDHYIRVYLKIKRGARKADNSLNDMGYITHCFNCLHRSPIRGLFPRLDKHCDECRSTIDFAGPLWLGNLWNHDILSEMSLEVNDFNISEKKRVKTIIEKILCEIKSPPTYYVLSHLCDHFNLQVPKLSKFIQSVKELGYSLSLTHFHPHGIKTEAPAKVLRKILEELSPN